MRTIFLPQISSTDFVHEDLVLDDKDYFHLINVLRLKTGDDVRVTNGKGLFANTKLNIQGKKSAYLKVEKYQIQDKDFSHTISLLCGIPKKSTVEEIIRLGIELGLKNICFWKSSYSQNTFPSQSRIELIVKNSMEQSNNFWEPTIHSFEKIPSNFFSNFDHLVIFHNKEIVNSKNMSTLGKNLTGNVLLLIGPEGGFSDSDLAYFQELNFLNLYSINLPTPIMTTPTAISCAVGYILCHLKGE